MSMNVLWAHCIVSLKCLNTFVSKCKIMEIIYVYYNCVISLNLYTNVIKDMGVKSL